MEANILAILSLSLCGRQTGSNGFLGTGAQEWCSLLSWLLAGVVTVLLLANVLGWGRDSAAALSARMVCSSSCGGMKKLGNSTGFHGVSLALTVAQL